MVHASTANDDFSSSINTDTDISVPSVDTVESAKVLPDHCVCGLGTAAALHKISDDDTPPVLEGRAVLDHSENLPEALSVPIVPNVNSKKTNNHKSRVLELADDMTEDEISSALDEFFRPFSENNDVSPCPNVEVSIKHTVMDTITEGSLDNAETLNGPAPSFELERVLAHVGAFGCGINTHYAREAAWHLAFFGGTVDTITDFLDQSAIKIQAAVRRLLRSRQARRDPSRHNSTSLDDHTKGDDSAFAAGRGLPDLPMSRLPVGGGRE